MLLAPRLTDVVSPSFNPDLNHELTGRAHEQQPSLQTVGDPDDSTLTFYCAVETYEMQRRGRIGTADKSS